MKEVFKALRDLEVTQDFTDSSSKSGVIKKGEPFVNPGYSNLRYAANYEYDFLSKPNKHGCYIAKGMCTGLNNAKEGTDYEYRGTLSSASANPRELI